MDTSPAQGALERKAASAATVSAQRHALSTLPSEDDLDFQLARRGFLAEIPNAEVPGAWSMAPYAFLEGERPETVNPSLWRQARLNAIHGLFEVTPGVYQARGFDISNITFIEGTDGYIVIDPLTSAEPAAAALALLRRTRGDRPVTAVIYTHSHVDHYGGVLGVVSEAQIKAGVPIIAPEGFLKAAVSENVLAGNVMSRRATYMYGGLLPKDAKGHVDSGLGKATSRGRVSLIGPTISVSHTGERLTVDGVEIIFQVTPDTEAPAEMNFFFPRFGALCMAENCTCTLHNLYTPRGAQVRDAKSWSRYIDEAARLFGGDSEVLFASHHWPRWGRAESLQFLSLQRDLYKYIHDQTLRLANHGLTPREIAEDLALPPALNEVWHTRSYYGTLSHNAKAVYQRYIGWFDGNPANLNPHPPAAAGRRYVDLAGGPDALLSKARAAFEAGDYRWVAEVVGHLVFADPSHLGARALQADAFEQMGYQAESGPWRDFYLTGAQELRRPRPSTPAPRQASSSQLRTLSGDDLIDSLSVRLNPKAHELGRLAFTLRFTDTKDSFDVVLENAVLHHAPGSSHDSLDLTRDDLVDLVYGEKTLEELSMTGPAAAALARLLERLDRFDLWFEISAP